MYTTASGVQIPQGTDSFSPATQFKNWADKAATYENRVIVATDGARTSLASPVLRDGLECYVQSTKKVWRYEGTTWVDRTTADTGWVNVTTLLNGWTATVPVRYRVLNGVVYWRGIVTGGATGAILNIPVGARPDPTGAGALAWAVNQAGTINTANRVTVDGTATQLVGASGQVPVLTGIAPYPADA